MGLVIELVRLGCLVLLGLVGLGPKFGLVGLGKFWLD